MPWYVPVYLSVTKILKQASNKQITDGILTKGENCQDLNKKTNNQKKTSVTRDHKRSTDQKGTKRKDPV